jgi:hypothetical protein
MIDQSKVIFVQILDMERYDGIYDDNGHKVDEYVHAGGSWPDEGKFEQFNFRNIEGKCLGYLPPYSKVNLKRINHREIKVDQHKKKYLDHVLVVFTTSVKNQGRYICGFYVNARLYEYPIDNKLNERKLNNGQFAQFSAIVHAQNAYLLNRSDRVMRIENGKNKMGGFGQSNMWYADQNLEYRKELIEYIEKVIDEKK